MFLLKVVIETNDRDHYVACFCQEWHTNTVMTIVYHVPNQIEVCQVDMTQYHVFQGEK